MTFSDSYYSQTGSLSLSQLYKGFHVKYLLFLSYFSVTLILNAHISNSKKVRPVRAELFIVDKQTEQS